MTFSLFWDVLKQCGRAVLDIIVPRNSGSRSYGKSVQKRQNTLTEPHTHTDTDTDADADADTDTDTDTYYIYIYIYIIKLTVRYTCEISHARGN
jgi:hypothetical protein